MPSGELRAGAPEDLALAGAIGAAFDQGDVTFDSAAGQFRIHGHPERTAVVHGRGAAVFWTLRALEREGYAAGENEIASAEADLTVRVTATAQDMRWQWRTRAMGAEREAASLETLLSEIRGAQ